MSIFFFPRLIGTVQRRVNCTLVNVITSLFLLKSVRVYLGRVSMMST